MEELLVFFHSAQHSLCFSFAYAAFAFAAHHLGREIHLRADSLSMMVDTIAPCADFDNLNIIFNILFHIKMI